MQSSLPIFPTVRAEALRLLPAQHPLHRCHLTGWLGIIQCTLSSLKKSFFSFLRPNPRHMEVPRTWIESEAHLWPTMGATILDPLIHHTRQGIEPMPLQQPQPLQSDSQPTAVQRELLLTNFWKYSFFGSAHKLMKQQRMMFLSFYKAENRWEVSALYLIRLNRLIGPLPMEIRSKGKLLTDEGSSV